MKKLTFAFRSDASFEIGNGHIIRCLTLADELTRRGGFCQFICREHSGNLISFIRKRGFNVIVLPAISKTDDDLKTKNANNAMNYSDWLGADWETDSAQTAAELASTIFDWLIVDHYTIGIKWERTLRRSCRNLMVIDDLADRVHDCDLLLDQNLGRVNSNYDGLVPPHCVVYTGPTYALLRKEFSLQREFSIERRNSEVKKILVSMGGVDKDNATGRVLDLLSKFRSNNEFEVTVVMGANAPWINDIRQKANATRWKTTVLVNVDNMARIMADSDLAIGAAGTSAWERCCVGLPALTIITAANQRNSALALEKIGAIYLVDTQSEFDEEFLKKLALLFDSVNLQQMQRVCLSVTDGRGADYVASTLINWHG